MSQITVKIDAPVVTLARFVELTGMPERTVRMRIANGDIPIIPKKTKFERPQINMVAFAAKCADLTNI